MSYDYFYPIQTTQGTGISITPGPHWDGTDSVDLSFWGNTVYNIAGGVVVFSVWNDYVHNYNGNTANPLEYLYSSGNCVAIQITDDCALKGKYVTYMHLQPDENGIKIGTFVPRGGIIGLVGNSGHSTGPHLHIQIREGSPWGSTNVIDWTRVASDEELRLNTLSSPRGATDYLIRYVQPKLKLPESLTSSSTDDVRLLCTIAILEGSILGEIGMEEIIAICYNRLRSSSFPNNIYNVIAHPNSFVAFYFNESLFKSGGYTIEQIKSITGNENLINFADNLLKGNISVSNSEGWAAGYNSLISKAYYFRSDTLISRDYLYTRKNNGYVHYYNGIRMWS